MKTKVLNTKGLLYIVMFTSMMAATSGFSLSFGQISITFQTFFVLLSGLTLGSKRAAVSMVIYILLGIIGLPVFSSFQSGYSVILGPSGGFLIAFPIAAFITGLKTPDNNYVLILKMTIASLVIYFLGILWMMFVLEIGLIPLLLLIFSFLPGDILKGYMVIFTYKKLMVHLSR
jgi:biotin transport system substrate-specific component